jgi:CheY-like chemotaxis protein
MSEPLTVLVVEDDAMVRDIIVTELADAGFAVIEAPSGDDALVILQRETSIDVLFTDIRMPGDLDGWDLAERARELRPKLPVIYASGFSATPAREVPGGVFLTKPYTTRVILDAVRRAGTSRTGG